MRRNLLSYALTYLLEMFAAQQYQLLLCRKQMRAMKRRQYRSRRIIKAYLMRVCQTNKARLNNHVKFRCFQRQTPRQLLLKHQRPLHNQIRPPLACALCSADLVKRVETKPNRPKPRMSQVLFPSNSQIRLPKQLHPHPKNL